MIRLVVSAALVLGSTVALAGEPDRPGSRDHPALTRMQHMHIVSYRTNPYERFAFRNGPGRGNEIPVEGQFFEIRYRADAGAPVPTPLAILRNHQDAVRAIGGKVVFEDKRYTTLQVAKDGKELWVLVDTAWGSGYQLTIVEKAAMAQEVKASAETFAAGLAATGHVEVPGILFDTGKATLKPESAAAVAEVARLLAADPGLRVFVVGHTDGVAAVELNLKLSQERAAAVVQELVSRHGVAASRLRAHGVGPFAPVASNDAEQGRAKNRRVELVKQ